MPDETNTKVNELQLPDYAIHKKLAATELVKIYVLLRNLAIYSMAIVFMVVLFGVFNKGVMTMMAAISCIGSGYFLFVAMKQIRHYKVKYQL